MLAPFCRTLPGEEVIVAARFRSNKERVRSLDLRIERVSLDYLDEASGTAFLDRLRDWHKLTHCVLWVHSVGHGFSQRLIKALANRRDPPLIVHLFGSNADSDRLIETALAAKVPFSPVRLGHVNTPTGWRWMTDDEISTLTAKALMGPAGTDLSPEIRARS